MTDKTIEEHPDHKTVSCINCGYQYDVYWEPRYSGYRGTCIKCGVNWAES